MNYAQRKILEYCENKSSPTSDLLYQLERESHLKTLAPQMISGHLQGKLLCMISKMIRPKRVLEIGTFTGYSALCLAEGIPDDGSLITLEANKELKYISDKYFTASPFSQIIESHHGDAKSIIPDLEGDFDLVFIDAGKRDYILYYDLVLPKTKSGGYILADNVIWSGKVTDQKKDKDTQILDDFNTYVLKDERVENLILPLRDGINIIRKKSPIMESIL